MKRAFSILLSGMILFSISSCNKAKEKIDELTEFDIKLPTTDAEIPASTATVATTQTFEIVTPDVPTGSASEFSKNKTSLDLVSEIKMAKLNISTTGNLDYMKSISVYIRSGNDEKRVAKKDVIPAGTTDLALDMDDVNIKDYISKDNIKFRINALLDGSKLPSTAQKLKIDGTAHVKATLIK